MELIICLTLAVSAFVVAITCIVGLVSAPTPILLAILATGMLLTQKSITKFTESPVNLTEDRDKNKVEKVEIASNTIVSEDSEKKTASMTYRGFNYNSRLKTWDKISPAKQNNLTYRGAKIDTHKKEIV